MELIIRPVRRDCVEYAEFARLHRIACSMAPGGPSRWNGELYTFDGSPWGGYDIETGRMLLSRQLVLDQLAGPPSAAQAEALATIYHESIHAKATYDTDHPNAVHSRATLVLDEALVERRTVNDFRAFAHRAGYDGLTTMPPEYSAAVAAADHILDYAGSPDTVSRQALAAPVPLRWDSLAGSILETHLPDNVPPEDEQSARFTVVTALTNAPWDDLQDRPRSAGTVLAGTALWHVDTALSDLRKLHSGFRPPMPTALGGVRPLTSARRLPTTSQRLRHRHRSGTARGSR